MRWQGFRLGSLVLAWAVALPASAQLFDDNEARRRIELLRQQVEANKKSTEERLLKAEAAAGTLVIAVLHDLAMAARFCDRLILIHEGRLVADGTPSAVLTPDNLRDCYDISAWIGMIEGRDVVLPLSRSQASRS